jgi:hypothetical protein
MSTAQRPSKIHAMDDAGSLVLATDLFCIDRPFATDWKTYKVSAQAVSNAILNQVPSTFIPGEDKMRDGWAVEFFEDYSLGANPTLDKGVGWDGNGAGSGLSIVSKNIYTGKAENRLQISNGQYGRKLFWGDSWNRIQMGIMFRINGAVSFNADGFVGLCSGTTNMVGSASTANFIGMKWASAVNSWLFTAGTKVNYYNQSLSTRWSTRRGIVTTDQGSGAGSDGRSFSATEGYRSMLFLEFQRPVFATDATSVSYSVGMRSTSTTLVEMSLSKRSFVDVMLDQVTSVVAATPSGSVMMSAGAVTHSFAFDQSTGKLDTFNFSWPNATQTMEVTAIAVRKVY